MNRRLSVLPVAAALCGVVIASAPAASAATPAHRFKNCTDLNKSYPHGVGKPGARDHVTGHSKPVTTFKRNTALYTANKKSDRDHDGIACEKG